MYNKEQVKLAIINCLDDQEAIIFKARHGLDIKAPLTIDQLLKTFEIDIDRFIQIESKVLAFLNKGKV